MNKTLNPVPGGEPRHKMATRVRKEAADLAHARVHSQTQENNGEAATALAKGTEWVYAPGTFSKGLEHDHYGRVRVADLAAFVSEINQDARGSKRGETPLPGTYEGSGAGCPAPFDVPRYVQKGNWNWPIDSKVGRNYESPLAGHTLEINGPDPDDTAMPPAPKLGSAELIAEIAEVYAMALIRDVNFTDWDKNPKVAGVVADLRKLDFFKGEDGLNATAKKRRAARFLDGGPLSVASLFRGSTPGAQKGPYISQFMLAGNAERPAAPESPPLSGAELATVTQEATDPFDRAAFFFPRSARDGVTEMGGAATGHAKGFVRYGPQAISQQLVPHRPGRDHMTDWGMWHDVQNGASRGGLDYPFLDADDKPVSRFITTPRDIATYVHFDALYQAYLNACLILLGEQAPSDVGLPEASGAGFGHPTRGGFALFGGPHVLTLVCEVATRALKAVRRQKYNVHLRARPEFLAAAITARWNEAKDGGVSVLGDLEGPLNDMVEALENCGLLGKISDHNREQNQIWTDNGWKVHPGWIAEDKNALLPMAFPEGSPMHPAYGAGHATVAGACVTVLKAFFEMFDVTDGAAFKDSSVTRGRLDLTAILADPNTCPATLFEKERTLEQVNFPAAYQANPDDNGATLRPEALGGLTVQGELDKLAANISIGRDFAGVHYYTDYYESLRMGERIAIGMLQEQMLTYREPLSMRLTSFDGDRILLAGTGGSRGLNDAPVLVWGRDGTPVNYKAWWTRH